MVVNRRLGMAIAVVVMGVIAFLLRQDGLLPEGWTPRPRENTQEESDTQETTDEVDVESNEPALDDHVPRRSMTPRQGRLLGAPRLAEVQSADDSVYGRIAGLVEDRLTGAPISNAQLTFRHEGQLFDARSDAEGRFRVEAPSEEPFTLALAEAEGYFSYAPAYGDDAIVFSTSAGQSVDDVRVRLEAVAEIRVVVHGPSGAPLPAQVRVLGNVEGSLAPADEYFDAPTGEVFVRAREDSTIEATSVEPRTLGHGRVSASAVLTGVLHIHTRAVAADNSPLRGQVLSLLGSEPIPGAQVEVESETSEGDILVAFLTADEDGYFVYEGHAPGPFSLWAHAPGYAAESRTHATRDDPAVLLLSEEASVVGRVIDEEGNPIPSFLVFAEAHVGVLERHLRAQSGTFDAGGEFRLGGLSSGGYTISVAADGYAPLTHEILLSRGQSARTEDFRLRRGLALEGLIRGSGGTHLAGARVQVESAIGGNGLPLSTEVQSNSEGEFRVEGLSPGQVFLTLAAAGHHGRIVAAQAGGAPIEITLNEIVDGEETQLELAGIGAALRAAGDLLVIDGLVDGGGAEEAGLVIGERVLQIDGVPVGTLGFQESIARIRGPVDSQVHLQVQGDAGERDVQVTRILVRI